MNRRKGIIAVIVALAGLGVAALPASAELHSVTVVLVTGQRITKTVDIAPGTPASQITVPGITGAIAQIIDNGPIAVPTPTGTPALPTPTVPAVPTVPGTKPKPSSTPTPDGNEKPGAPNRRQGGSGSQSGSGNANAPANQKFKAGNLNRKKLVSQLEKQAKKKAKAKEPGRAVDGSPTLDNPTFSLAMPGAAPIGVPNFFIDKFRIPPFLLPLYQAAGIEYGVRWEVLAAINEIETDYGRNLNVSTAGAEGWMQFMPATWKQYGVDANKDNLKDPYNPADAIFATARYLKAAGAETDLRKAVFAYNHADWYVDSVLMRARLIGGLPSNFVGSLTGLTQGHFPVAAKATYADDLTEADAKKLGKRSSKKGNRALVVEGSKHRRGINIFARRGAPVIAVNDGKIVRMGRTKRLGSYVQLQDTYGNTYTYARLAKVAKSYPAPRERTTTAKQVAKELKLPKDAKPTAPASSTTVKATKRAAKPKNTHAKRGKVVVKPTTPAVTTKQRLFAHPQRPNAGRAGGKQQVFQRTGKIDGSSSFRSYFTKVFGLDRKDVRIKRLRPGSRIVAGTILGRIGKTSSVQAPHMLFEIRPAGGGAPRIDPKPILDGWKLLESTAIYRAAGKNPFFGPDAKQPTIGQILLMSKEALVQHVLANPRIEIYSCGREDIRTGQIDRRVLATLEFLAASGLRPTVSTLKCGHSLMTVSGNISQHSSGNAVDIAKINGIPIVGHQGKGSITELTVQRLLTLQGTMKPDQIITLMQFAGADNTLSMADHYDHIHIGWKPLYGTNSKAAKQVNAVLKPKQWIKLIDRLEEIDNPSVSLQPSKHALKVTERASEAHRGE
jgi:murein DD-endopeptidase MepM/ murein hydrolase activator NlpD